MNTAGPALPFAHFVKAPAADQTTGTTPGTFTTLAFGTSVVNNGGGIIDAPAASQIRVLAAGYYRVGYEIFHFNGGNNNARAMEARVIINAATVPSELQSAGNANNALDNGSSIYIEQPILLAANDLLEVEASPLQAVAHTIVAAYSKFTIELIRLT